jgi:Ca2+-binding RTX toxin-like protein
VASFAGQRAGYEVKVNGSTVTVTDSNTADGDDGVDVLTGVEVLRFADGVVELGGVTSIGGTAGAETLDLRAAGGQLATGGAGNDVYLVNAVGDAVLESALGGTDTVRSSISWTLWEDVENLILTGSAALDGAGNSSANQLSGNSGANSLAGYAGADTLRGGAGDDRLNGGAGADMLVGGNGDDTYQVTAGDQINESADGGVDTVNSSISWTLGANIETLTLGGADAIDGSGNAGANTVNGNGAANTLNGQGGADTLRGLAGDDALHGGSGNDTLTGGEGADVFVFETALSPTTNADTVTDFSPGTDRLLLDHEVFGSLAAGELAAAQFRSGADVTRAADNDDRILYDTSTGALYYDADGAGGNAALRFAVIGTTAHPALSAADFLIVG